MENSVNLTATVSSPLKREGCVTSGWQVSFVTSADLSLCGSFLKHCVEEDSAAVDGLPGRLVHNQLSPQAQQMENGCLCAMYLSVLKL